MTRPTPIVLTALTLAPVVNTTQTADAVKAVAVSKPEARAGAALAKVIQESSISEDPATAEGVTERDDVQKVYSRFADRNVAPVAVAKKPEDAQFKTIHYPADNTQLGDWKEDEKAAWNGRGMQFSDPVGTVNGANCYAYHRLPKDELSYGITDPSLYQYGKLRSGSEAILRYTWGKIYNSSAYAACFNMLRSGHRSILIEQQTHDVAALLLDPASPVNQ